MYLDIIDLMFMRAKALQSYRYSRRTLSIVYTVFILVDAVLFPEGHWPIWGSVLFNVALGWLLVLAAYWFFGWWLRKKDRWNGQGDLLQVVILVHCTIIILDMVGQFIGLGSWGAFTHVSQTARVSGLLVAVYAFFVFCEALHKSTGVARGHIFSGAIIFSLSLPILPISLLALIGFH